MEKREHPRGAARLAGAQLRYLVASQHGYLGALGISSSALALAARNNWIGWQAAQRQRRLHRVVAMSRFLIRPQVRCRYLASTVLGMALRRLPGGFERLHGYRPVLMRLLSTFQSTPGPAWRRRPGSGLARPRAAAALPRPEPRCR